MVFLVSVISVLVICILARILGGLRFSQTPAPEPEPQPILVQTVSNPSTRPWSHRSQSPRTREPPVESPDPAIAKQQLEQIKAEFHAFVGQDFEVAVKTINDMGYDVKILFAVEPTEYKVPRCGVAHGQQYYYGVVLYVKNRLVTKIDIPVDPSGLRIWQDDRPCRDDTNSWCKDQPQCINVRPHPNSAPTEVYK